MLENFMKKEGDDENAKEAVEPKPITGITKYLIAGLGVLVMVGGIGFVAMQMLGGQGSSSQQMMLTSNQAQVQQEDQTSLKLQELLEKSKASAQDSMVAEVAPEAAAQPSPEPKSEAVSVKADDDFMVQRQTVEARSDTTSEQMEAILERLAAIEVSVSDRIEGMASVVQDLKYGIATNGDRVAELAGRMKNAGSGVDIEKYAQLLVENQDLKKEVESLEGKYEWVRHLESKNSTELAAAKNELESAQKQIAELSRRPVFGEWQLAGVSSDEMLLVNPYNGQIKRLRVGESFQGVTVEKINALNGMVSTNAGTIRLG